jgi:hypothetical protein
MIMPRQPLAIIQKCIYLLEEALAVVVKFTFVYAFSTYKS